MYPKPNKARNDNIICTVDGERIFLLAEILEARKQEPNRNNPLTAPNQARDHSTEQCCTKTKRPLSLGGKWQMAAAPENPGSHSNRKQALYDLVEEAEQGSSWTRQGLWKRRILCRLQRWDMPWPPVLLLDNKYQHFSERFCFYVFKCWLVVGLWAF